MNQKRILLFPVSHIIIFINTRIYSCENCIVCCENYRSMTLCQTQFITANTE